MKRVKVHGRKKWENGWKGRQVCKRRIEVAFRQTKAADIGEQDEREDVPTEAQQRCQQDASFAELIKLFVQVV